MPIEDIALKLFLERLTIEKGGDKESGRSVLAARHDVDDYILIQPVLNLNNYLLQYYFLFYRNLICSLIKDSNKRCECEIKYIYIYIYIYTQCDLNLVCFFFQPLQSIRFRHIEFKCPNQNFWKISIINCVLLYKEVSTINFCSIFPS